jgi:hypothetical protein
MSIGRRKVVVEFAIVFEVALALAIAIALEDVFYQLN